MPSKEVSDNHLEHLTPAALINLWDEYTKIILASAIHFHGCDSSSCSSGAEHIAELADKMVELRMERLISFKQEIKDTKDKEDKSDSKIKE